MRQERYNLLYTLRNITVAGATVLLLATAPASAQLGDAVGDAVDSVSDAVGDAVDSVGDAVGGSDGGLGDSVDVSTDDGIGVDADVGGVSASAQVGGNDNNIGSADVSIGGLSTTSSTTAGNGSTSSNTNVGLGGLFGAIGLVFGGSNSNVDVGVGAGNGTGGPSGPSGPGAPGLPSNDEVASALEGLTPQEAQRLRFKCQRVLSAPARYSAAQVQVCNVLASL